MYKIIEIDYSWKINEIKIDHLDILRDYIILHINFQFELYDEDTFYHLKERASKKLLYTALRIKQKKIFTKTIV